MLSVNEYTPPIKIMLNINRIIPHITPLKTRFLRTVPCAVARLSDYRD